MIESGDKSEATSRKLVIAVKDAIQTDRAGVS